MAEQVKPSSEKISEALQLLEEAAKDKKDELRTMITEKYGNVKDVLSTKEQQMSEAVKKARDYASGKATHYKDYGTQKAKEVSTAVDEEVHRNPWPYIGGAALGALLLGFILGRKN